MSDNQSTGSPFLDKVDIELQRAERYRIFVSLAILDFGFLSQGDSETDSELIQRLSQFVAQKIRAIDNVSVVEGKKLAFLFPETTRQEAEIASKRLRELLMNRLAELTEQAGERTVPFEMVSYPDAAGAKSIKQFLEEMSGRDRN